MLLKNTHLSSWITANQRLALHFRQQYDQAQQATNKSVWETLDCLSLKRWILRAYHSLPDSTQFVLSENQEIVLWENVIVHSTNRQPELAFLSTRSVAKTAQAAWRLLKESETPLHLLAASDSQEVKAFYQWARTFEQHCHEKNCIDFSVCMQEVIAAIAAKKLVLPVQITLAGFEEISVQTKRLFALLSEQCEVKYPEAKKIKAHSQRVGLGNEEVELQAMAQWAYQRQLENPNQLIGCVVPDLNAKRHTVERIFNAVFTSEATFNISGGFPFHHFPLVQTAFDILKLGISALDMALLSRLLGSPFLGGAEQELTARADLDMLLRETLEPQIYWQKMQYFAKKHGRCAIWMAQCEQYLAHYNSADEYQSAYAWGQYFAQQLRCMGWPGERVVNSSEYQQVQRWYSLLEELGNLDAVLEKPLSRTQALHHLYHLAQATVFQPQTVKASVQVLGLLEAVGLPFASLWISGMTQESWPSNAAPNPFIPFALQCDRNMPHASAERELIYSRMLTQHFCQSAAMVIFSYALQKEDRSQAPSALIRDIAEISAIELCPLLDLAALQHPAPAQTALEYIEDQYAPRVQAEEVLRGGANVFRHQAACPFRAFARLRLGATGIPLPAFSMTPQERGICLHAVLEQVWRVLGDHQTLCQYDHEALDRLLKPMVSEVLSAAAKQRVFTLKPRFIALEQQRLTQQVMAWLTLEKQRPPFRVVGLESEQQMQFAGLSLKLRVDREDELEDGTHVIVDYKTGACSPADWFGERPDDPQLPLYGVACTRPIGALAFAQISADKLQFTGIGEKEDGIAGVQAITHQKLDKALYTWEAFFTATRATLTRLALEFQAGHAKVDPKQLEQTCRYCDLQSLCRINDGA